MWKRGLHSPSLAHNKDVVHCMSFILSRVLILSGKLATRPFKFVNFDYQFMLYIYIVLYIYIYQVQ